MVFRTPFLLFGLAVAAAWAQPDMPRAIVNGKPMTFSDVEPLVGTLPPELQKNPEEVFRAYGFFQLLAGKAEAAKLDQQSPYKEQLDLARKQMLANAFMNNFRDSLDIGDEEMKAYYQKHKEDFVVASVTSMLIPVKSKEDGPAALEAAQKAAKALKDGTDLAQMAALYPADLKTIRKNDQTVDADLRSAVFALHPKDVSGPIVQKKGIYVIRLDSISSANFDDLKPHIRAAIADERFLAFIDEMRKSVTVQMVKK